ncbi:MAG TPA: hypothetical protein VKA66_15670 [Mycobacterium sp.]|nr:hypothetical protein [Mycobacterium sp.]
MGRHELPRNRRRSSAVLAVLLAPAAMFFATASDVRPFAARDAAEPVVNDIAPCRAEIVAATPNMAHSLVGKGFTETPFAPASRYHTRSRFLPVGAAPERGLQVRTILTARSISDAFPEIHQMGGVRPDPLPWHPLGLAVDVMIPDPTSAEGIALGNKIVAYVMANANRFGIQDAIWRGVYYTPNGGRSSAAGHYDHVHVTTTGGGYAKGGETYLR